MDVLIVEVRIIGITSVQKRMREKLLKDNKEKVEVSNNSQTEQDIINNNLARVRLRANQRAKVKVNRLQNNKEKLTKEKVRELRKAKVRLSTG